MKRKCRIWKKEQKEQKSASSNQKSAITNEGETIAIVSDSDVLFTVSMEDACLYTSISRIDLILVSGAYHHVTPSKTNFVSYEVGDYGRVHLGNNHFCDIVGVGDVQIQTKDGHEILLNEVNHFPKMHMSLILVGQLDDEGFSTNFGKSGWKINKGALVIARGFKIGTLYTLRETTRKSNVASIAKEETSLDLWHKRLGHMSEKGL